MSSVLTFQTIDSTNSYLKREYKNLPDKTVVMAYHQTQGKGRLGREWKDDKESLMFSILLKEKLDMNRISLLPLLVGISISKALDDYRIPNQIKWPNDILIKEKKACGILLESVVEKELEALIIGVGVNLNDETFPAELKEKAISLYQATGKKYDKVRFLDCFLLHFHSYYEMFLQGDDSYLDILKGRSYLDGKEVLLNYYGEDIHGIVKGIDREGNLLVDVDGALKSFHSGEVTLEKNYH